MDLEGLRTDLEGRRIGPLCGDPSDLFDSPFVVIDFFESFGNWNWKDFENYELLFPKLEATQRTD